MGSEAKVPRTSSGLRHLRHLRHLQEHAGVTSQEGQRQGRRHELMARWEELADRGDTGRRAASRRAGWTRRRPSASVEHVLLRLGELTRSDLKKALTLAGVHLNASAETLLEDAVFERVEAETIEIVQRDVRELGLDRGASLPQILTTAREHGLSPCPPVTGPYLRLAMVDQETAPDSVLSNGRAPTGSVTVASEPLRVDDDYPKGFYLRVVDGRPWLRGYRCGDDHLWSPGDRFAFRM